ncbi:hypothetical protein AVEN_73640-1 [Araneus ventricosus]|uniref:CCHC-type domain-containing protein n=1 Tax=Araneus ventricosus TaxID=182803 RepID=A0A4Y2Q642_ARAVE|nr:hypothetical protein AVEN_73640-1 [Araneus ventricosus]
MRLSVRTYIPNSLRCFQCQRFGHSKTSCRGTLTCARCAEVGHENTDCTSVEKCVNGNGEQSSFYWNCFAWKQEKEIISTKIKKQISYQEARKLVKSETPTSGNSYVSVAKISASAPSADRNKDISTVSLSKSSYSTTRACPPITNLPIPSSSSVAPVSEEALALIDLTDFTLVWRSLTKNGSSTNRNVQGSLHQTSEPPKHPLLLDKGARWGYATRASVLHAHPTRRRRVSRRAATPSVPARRCAVEHCPSPPAPPHALGHFPAPPALFNCLPSTRFVEPFTRTRTARLGSLQFVFLGF